ncbi:MAG: hypothetical protein JWL81_2951 [Verrucomicrobiales bacterium]|nr:hypothetical protein [Verrucomicrobiales bacterium]
MPCFSKLSPFPVCRLVVPLLGLTLLPFAAVAGNQSGPGWQQAKSKGQAASPVDSAPSPAAAPAKGFGIGKFRLKSKKAAAAAAAEAQQADPTLFPDPAMAAEAPRRTAPPEEMIQRQVPGTGPLLEDDLIRLAIANNPELARRRSEILIARAKVKGAGDWENPELRIGYSWEHDERLTEPFVESSTERIRANERYTQTQSVRNLAAPFYPGAGDSQTQRDAGSLNTTRYRTIERRVTPGRYKDVIDTTVYERRNSRETFSRNTSDTEQGVTFPTAEAGSQNTDRRIVERSREIVRHPDDYSRDDQLSILVRFRVPNPWERRANIEIAAAETARAESDYLIEEDKLIRTVRALYEDLNMAESVSRSSSSRRSFQEKYGAEVEAANFPELADLAADIRLEVGKAIREQREFRSDIARLREELAVYCGLDKPDRIGVIGKPTRRIVPVDALDVDYLISMAQLHRSDLLDLKSRLAVAKAELMGAKAAKIPFVTFFDAGWATAQSTGRTGETEEWSVRAGISLPLFDWFGINKAHLEHRTATEAYTKQIDEQRRLIAVEIRTALDRIRSASKELKTYDADLARIRSDSAKSIEQTAIDPIKNLKTRYQNEDLIAKFEEDRYEVWSDYYKAVMELERALGTRLEKVLRR